MQELISVAQVGRSLGVHLSLATQNQEVLLTIRYGVIQDSEFVLKCRKGKIAWICFITWMPARLHKQEEDTCR